MDCPSQKGYFPFQKVENYISESTPSIPALWLKQCWKSDTSFWTRFQSPKCASLPHFTCFASLCQFCPTSFCLFSSLYNIHLCFEFKNSEVIWNRPHFLSGISLMLQIINISWKAGVATMTKIQREHLNNLYMSDKVICSQNRGWHSKSVSKMVFRTFLNFSATRDESQLNSCFGGHSLNVVSILSSFPKYSQQHQATACCCGWRDRMGCSTCRAMKHRSLGFVTKIENIQI